MTSEKPIVTTKLKHAGWGGSAGPILIIVLAVLFCYLPYLNAPLVFDSGKLESRRQMQVVKPLWIAATESSRSLVDWTFAVNYQLGYPDLRGYMGVNILIHIAAALVLFGLIRRTLLLPRTPEPLQSAARGLALAAALVWAVHPLQTQAVTYVIQRYESLMALFFLAAMYCVLRGSQSARSWLWYGGAILASLLGMVCKPVMAMAAPVILLYDRAFLAGSWKELLRRRWWLHASLWATALWGVYLVRGALDPATETQAVGLGLPVVTPWEYFRTQPQIILHYVRLAIWPDALCLDYMWPVATTAWEIYLPGAVVALLLAACVIGFSLWPRVAFLGLAFYLILAPTSSIMPIRDLAVEHRMYLPLAAVAAAAIMAAYGLVLKLVKEPAGRRLLLVSGLVIVVLALIARTHLRNRDYLDPVRLWTKVLSVAPGNFRAHGVLGNYRLASGDLEAAEKHYQKAIELDPSYPSAHLGFARLLAQLGRDGDAEQQFQLAVELEPDYALAFDSWGNFYARKGQYDRALEKYQQAVRVDPEFALPHFHRGVALFEKREFALARAALETALGLSPKFTQAKLRLAEILASAPDASLRDGRRALSLVNEVVGGVRNPDAKMLDVLAMAYAETSQFSQALEAARHARHLALAADDRDLVRTLDERQDMYKKQQPFRLVE